VLKDTYWLGAADAGIFRRPAPPPTESPAPAWDHLLVAAVQAAGAWRARYVNGGELPAWADGPDVAQRLAGWGSEGWEVVNMTHVEPFLYFLLKRPRA
jgi:hypothetical protein